MRLTSNLHTGGSLIDVTARLHPRLTKVAELLGLSMQSEPTFKCDEKPLGPLLRFSKRPL